MGEKKVKGRKRQIVVDTQGNLHEVFVHKANIHDSKGGAVLADIVLKQQKQVKKMLADLGYRGFFEEVVRVIHKRSVEFSSKIVGEFRIQPKRWIVERTIAWLNWSRRLSKDFEQKCIYSENIIRIAAIALIIRQIH
jgi:transposase